MKRANSTKSHFEGGNSTMTKSSTQKSPVKHIDHKQILRDKQEKRKVELNESMKKMESIDEFANIMRAKEKIFQLQKDREKVSESVDEIRKEYQKVREDIKLLLREQITSSSKMATRKPKVK